MVRLKAAKVQQKENGLWFFIFIKHTNHLQNSNEIMA
jgi:hypothetical protein